MKRGPRAKTILVKSLKDIAAGNWTTGTLGADLAPKCAIGLVSYHGHGRTEYLSDGVVFRTTGETKAIEALYAAMPVKYQDRKYHKTILKDDPWYDPVTLKHDSVIDYNDTLLSDEAAAKWFGKALAAVS